jgi:hypothetical protein
VDIGGAGPGLAKEDIDLFERAEEADEKGRMAARRAAIAMEVGRAKLAVASDDGAAHGAIFVSALSPGFLG